MLADMDPQHSTGPWLAKRHLSQPPGVPIVGQQMEGYNPLRFPQGVRQIVVDTPGGLHGVKLSRVLMSTSGILLPVCDSAFDRESSADFLAELRSNPSVASGRIPLAAVGMRVDGRTHGAEILQEWALTQQVPLLGVLRTSQTYVRCIERGLTIFDLRESLSRDDLLQWKPILEWLTPVLMAGSSRGVAHKQPGPQSESKHAQVLAPTRLGSSRQPPWFAAEPRQKQAPATLQRPSDSPALPAVSTHMKGLLGLFDRWLFSGQR